MTFANNMRLIIVGGYWGISLECYLEKYEPRSNQHFIPEATKVQNYSVQCVSESFPFLLS